LNSATGATVSGTRISLDSVVYAFDRDDSPERTLEEFPLLDKLFRVYGAIAFCLDHKAEIDNLEETEREFDVSGIPLAIDFASAAYAELEGVGDPELLGRAARENRVLVSHDRPITFETA
jgi:uncharacterized protein (DUF433 family)